MYKTQLQVQLHYRSEIQIDSSIEVFLFHGLIGVKCVDVINHNYFDFVCVI